MSTPHQADVHDSVNMDLVSRRVLAVCDKVGDFIAYWGFKSIHGRIWAYLALYKVPVPQAELARVLNVSRSLVSESMAELQRWGLVRPASDEHHAPYTAVVDIWPTISDVLRTREWLLIESTRMSLEGALEAIEREERAGNPSPFDASRVRLLLTMTEIAQAFIRLLIRMRQAPTDSFGQWVAKASGMLKLFRN